MITALLSAVYVIGALSLIPLLVWWACEMARVES